MDAVQYNTGDNYEAELKSLVEACESAEHRICEASFTIFAAR